HAGVSRPTGGVWSEPLRGLEAGSLLGGSAPRRLIAPGRDVRREGGLHTLYISPLKALAVDIARNLERPVAEMRLPIRVETRTGDTPRPGANASVATPRTFC